MPRQILVTGASSHLGRALVARASARGHRVLAVSRGEGGLSHVSQCDVNAVSGIDLTDSASLQLLRQRIENDWAGQFSVVNCVGYFAGYRNVEDIGIEDARRVIESNFLAVYGPATTLVQLMKERGGGDFITFSAHSQYQSYPKMAAFNGAKAAVEALTQTLSNEAFQHGVRCNCFALATLLTPEERKMKPRGDHHQWLQPEEVASRVIEFVERADPLVSGNTFQLFKYSKSYFGESYEARIKT